MMIHWGVEETAYRLFITLRIYGVNCSLLLQKKKKKKKKPSICFTIFQALISALHFLRRKNTVTIVINQWHKWNKWHFAMSALLKIGSGYALYCCQQLSVDINDTKNIREDAYSRTGGIFIRDTAGDTAYLLWFNEVWPYASLNHNEYAVSPAVSRMKMLPVREYASSLLSTKDVWCRKLAFVW